MAILKIARMGHPVLSLRAAEVEDPTMPDIRTLVANMVDTMIDAEGAGLAAPQVYMPLRLVVFQAPGEHGQSGPDVETAPLTVLINPIIEILDPQPQGGWEGCLSLPGLRGYVERPSHIRYSGIDHHGRPLMREATGFHARVVLHECDHLDGILYPQRMQNLMQLIFESEARHWAMGG